jgi:hypothetical protein
MSRPIPALDPRGSRAERTGFIRTEAISLPPADRPREGEDPGLTLWAGPKPGRRRARRTPTLFHHSVELPYPVDAGRAEVRKENGLISIILKKD